MTEMIEVIDNDMNVLRVASREEIRAKNLKHKTALIVLKNSKGEIYVDQRKHTKIANPLKWVIGAGGMVRPNESFEQGAQRELKEELGVEAALKFLFDFDFKDAVNNYKAKVFLATHDGEIELDSEECEQGKWLTTEEVRDYMKKGLLCPDTALFVQKYLVRFEK